MKKKKKNYYENIMFYMCNTHTHTHMHEHTFEHFTMSCNVKESFFLDPGKCNTYIFKWNIFIEIVIAWIRQPDHEWHNQLGCCSTIGMFRLILSKFLTFFRPFNLDVYARFQYFLTQFFELFVYIELNEIFSKTKPTK